MVCTFTQSVGIPRVLGRFSFRREGTVTTYGQKKVFLESNNNIEIRHSLIHITVFLINLVCIALSISASNKISPSSSLSLMEWVQIMTKFRNLLSMGIKIMYLDMTV